MVEYTKVKRLEHEFKRVRLSQDDLKRIGSFFKDKEEDERFQLEIEIVSLDGEETITCSDPEIFSSNDLPKEIRSVNFSLDVIQIQKSNSIYLVIVKNMQC